MLGAPSLVHCVVGPSGSRGGSRSQEGPRPRPVIVASLTARTELPRRAGFGESILVGLARRPAFSALIFLFHFNSFL